MYFIWTSVSKVSEVNLNLYKEQRNSRINQQSRENKGSTWRKVIPGFFECLKL